MLNGQLKLRAIFYSINRGVADAAVQAAAEGSTTETEEGEGERESSRKGEGEGGS